MGASMSQIRKHVDPLQAPPSVHDYAWQEWSPGVKATLVFVRQGKNVLLIEKKRGLGEGKMNAPGGKCEGDESWEDCASRELTEEVNLEGNHLQRVAILHFLMSDYPDILCHVFMTHDFIGIAEESDEALPFWCNIDDIPYHQMWEDDQYWLPQVLAGEKLKCYFSFIGEKMCTQKTISISSWEDCDL
jgi:8-oxo-dGTP diphosphatase